MPRLSLLFLLALLVPQADARQEPAAGGPGSSEWPHWLGPDRNGISKESGWSVVGEAEPLWRAELGLGYANVSISDGRLFTTGFDEAGGEDVVWCLDPETGEELWTRASAAQNLARFHGGGTLTTPSVEGDRIYVSNRFGRLVCLSAVDGALLWERDYSEEVEFKQNFHGCSASPLVLEDRLILGLSGVTAAVSKEDGAVLWQTEDHGDGSHANPIPFELDGTACLAAISGRGLSILEIESGEQLQFHEWEHTSGGINAATPIVFGTRVLISAAYDKGAALFELGGETPGMVWRCRKMRNKVSSCILWRDHFFGFDESMLRCIDLEGNAVWNVRGLGMGTLSMADGKLLILSSKGELIIGEADPEEFVELSRTKVLDEGVYWTPPVLLNGLIYCRNSLGSLVCLDHRSAGPAVVASGDAELADLPKAETLFARHVEAIGGEAAWRKHTSMKVEGEIEITGAGITRTPMTIQRAAPTSWLLSYSIGPFGSVHRGYDGEVAWQLDPFYGNHLEKGDALREIEETRPFHAELDWGELYATTTTTGRVTFGDRPCWKVEAVSRKGTRRQLFFDVETGFQVGRAGATEAQVVFADYREFEGLHLPTRITRLLPETGAEESYFVSAVTFDEVDPSVFERPVEVVKMLWTPEEVAAADGAARERFGAFLGVYVGDAEPIEGAELTAGITRGDLVVSIAGQPEIPLGEPDDDGWFSLGPGMGFSLRFEDEKEGVTGTLRLRLQTGEVTASRKREEADD